MRLIEMGQALIEGRTKRGLGMKVTVDGEVTRLSYAWGDEKPIAEVTDRRGDSYTLTIYGESQSPYVCISHCNRIRAVFLAISGGRWSNLRYSSFQRWGYVKIWDSKLRIEITASRLLTFQVRGDQVNLDYAKYERECLDEGKPKEGGTPATVTLPSITNDSTAEINNLMALVADL